MGILEQFEQRLDHLLSGALTAAFDEEVQPVEIIAAITREMDEHLQELSSGRMIAPNHFIVDLAQHDYDRMNDYLKTLEAEFADVAAVHAKAQNYTLTGPVVINVMMDKDLDAGVFRVSFEQVAASSSNVVESTKPAAVLLIRGVAHQLVKPINRIGRSPDADIVISDPTISRIHAEITIGTQVTLRDLGSTNGTWHNDERITELVLTGPTKFNLGSIEVSYQ